MFPLLTPCLHVLLAAAMSSEPMTAAERKRLFEDSMAAGDDAEKAARAEPHRQEAHLATAYTQYVSGFEALLEEDPNGHVMRRDALTNLIELHMTRREVLRSTPAALRKLLADHRHLLTKYLDGIAGPDAAKKPGWSPAQMALAYVEEDIAAESKKDEELEKATASLDAAIKALDQARRGLPPGDSQLANIDAAITRISVAASALREITTANADAERAMLAGAAAVGDGDVVRASEQFDVAVTKFLKAKEGYAADSQRGEALTLRHADALTRARALRPAATAARDAEAKVLAAMAMGAVPAAIDKWDQAARGFMAGIAALMQFDDLGYRPLIIHLLERVQDTVDAALCVGDEARGELASCIAAKLRLRGDPKRLDVQAEHQRLVAQVDGLHKKIGKRTERWPKAGFGVSLGIAAIAGGAAGGLFAVHKQQSAEVLDLNPQAPDYEAQRAALEARHDPVTRGLFATGLVIAPAAVVSTIVFAALWGKQARDAKRKPQVRPSVARLPGGAMFGVAVKF